jgi:hypothetical protein
MARWRNNNAAAAARARDRFIRRERAPKPYVPSVYELTGRRCSRVEAETVKRAGEQLGWLRSRVLGR